MVTLENANISGSQRENNTCFLARLAFYTTTVKRGTDNYGHHGFPSASAVICKSSSSIFLVHQIVGHFCHIFQQMAGNTYVPFQNVDETLC